MLGEHKRAIRSLALPLSISYLVLQVNLFVDIYWAAGLGVDPLSSIGTMSPVYYMLSAIGVGLGVGVSSRAAFYMGKTDKESASKIITNTIVLAILLSALISLAMFPLIDPLISFMGADGIHDFCVAYCTPFFLMIVAITMNGVVAGMLRAEGARGRSVIILISTAVANVILDPILIYVLDMGVAGAGWASSLSSLVSTILGLSWYAAGKTAIPLKLRRDYVNKQMMSEVFDIGGPRSFESLITNASNILQRLIIIAVGGTTGVMLYSVPMRYPMLAEVPSDAIGAAAIPVCSAALGQNDPEKMKRGMIYSAKLSMGVSLTLCALILIFAEPMMSVLSYSPDVAEHFDELVWILRVYALLIPLDGYRKLGSCLMQVLGRSGTSTLLMMFWAFLKIALYYVAFLTGSFENLIIMVTIVYSLGGVIMMCATYHYVKKKYPRQIPTL